MVSTVLRIQNTVKSKEGGVNRTVSNLPFYPFDGVLVQERCELEYRFNMRSKNVYFHTYFLIRIKMSLPLEVLEHTG